MRFKQNRWPHSNVTFKNGLELSTLRPSTNLCDKTEIYTTYTALTAQPIRGMKKPQLIIVIPNPRIAEIFLTLGLSLR
jgi:hypothetical protein